MRFDANTKKRSKTKMQQQQLSEFISIETKNNSCIFILLLHKSVLVQKDKQLDSKIKRSKLSNFAILPSSSVLEAGKLK
jgi:hypothetical protein